MAVPELTRRAGRRPPSVGPTDHAGAAAPRHARWVLLRRAGVRTLVRRLSRRVWSDLTVVNVARTADVPGAVAPAGPGFTVEVVVPCDADLRALVATAAGSDALLMRRMLGRTRGAEQVLLMARLDGRAVGVCAVVKPRRPGVRGRTAEGTPSSQEALIGSLYITPDARGRGLATLLVAGAAEEGMRRGAERLIALIDEGNDASLRTFSRVGFVPVSRTRTRFRLNRRRDLVEPVGAH